MVSLKDVAPYLKHTGADGNGVPDEGKADVTRKKVKPNGADREGNAPATRKRKKRNLAGWLKLCRKKAADAVASEEQATLKLEDALCYTYKADDYTRRKPNARKRLKRAYKEEGIRITGSTTNDFIPLVKLIFGDIPAATISRYASALWLAREEGTKPDRFIDFLRKNGGVTGCAELASARRVDTVRPNFGEEDAGEEETDAIALENGGAAKRTGLGAEKRDGTARPDLATLAKQKLKERRKDALVFKIPQRVNPPDEGGQHLVLVELTKDGEYRYLGHRTASERDILSILTD